ncbi:MULTISPECIES: WhiB family transcriptional regulator [unclassified Mycobacterium]|uniref:WhiB family transcriptional regulator n=1 Tax=unclassified Mycobacterium TaxID=2642494 RepID=UPI0026F44CE9|nr:MULTISPECIES: WhiB family transcriptional regulator [unclassified Mycobacterium]
MTTALKVKMPSWVDDAICAQIDPEVFFPETGQHTTHRAAKRICRGCPVKQDCLDWALTNGELYGIWGGHSQDERKRLKTRRRA